MSDASHTACRYCGIGERCNSQDVVSRGIKSSSKSKGTGGGNQLGDVSSGRTPILRQHNSYRRKVRDRFKYSEECVPNLRWDDELSEIAQIWADQCANAEYPENTYDEGGMPQFPKVKHESNPIRTRSTTKFKESPGVGQNIAWFLTRKPGVPNFSKVIDDLWYKDNFLSTINGDKVFDEVFVNKSSPESTLTTQILWGRTTHIGCGWIQFKLDSTSSVYPKQTRNVRRSKKSIPYLHSSWENNMNPRVAIRARRPRRSVSASKVFYENYLVCNYGIGGNVLGSPIFQCGDKKEGEEERKDEALMEEIVEICVKAAECTFEDVNANNKMCKEYVFECLEKQFIVDDDEMVPDDSNFVKILTENQNLVMEEVRCKIDLIICQINNHFEGVKENQTVQGSCKNMHKECIGRLVEDAEGVSVTLGSEETAVRSHNETEETVLLPISSDFMLNNHADSIEMKVEKAKQEGSNGTEPDLEETPEQQESFSSIENPISLTPPSFNVIVMNSTDLVSELLQFEEDEMINEATTENIYTSDIIDDTLEDNTEVKIRNATVKPESSTPEETLDTVRPDSKLDANVSNSSQLSKNAISILEETTTDMGILRTTPLEANFDSHDGEIDTVIENTTEKLSDHNTNTILLSTSTVESALKTAAKGVDEFEMEIDNMTIAANPVSNDVQEQTVVIPESISTTGGPVLNENKVEVTNHMEVSTFSADHHIFSSVKTDESALERVTDSKSVSTDEATTVEDDVFNDNGLVNPILRIFSSTTQAAVKNVTIKPSNEVIAIEIDQPNVEHVKFLNKVGFAAPQMISHEGQTTMNSSLSEVQKISDLLLKVKESEMTSNSNIDNHNSIGMSSEGPKESVLNVPEESFDDQDDENLTNNAADLCIKVIYECIKAITSASMTDSKNNESASCFNVISKECEKEIDIDLSEYMRTCILSHIERDAMEMKAISHYIAKCRDNVGIVKEAIVSSPQDSNISTADNSSVTITYNFEMKNLTVVSSHGHIDGMTFNRENCSWFLPKNDEVNVVDFDRKLSLILENMLNIIFHDNNKQQIDNENNPLKYLNEKCQVNMSNTNKGINSSFDEVVLQRRRDHQHLIKSIVGRFHQKFGSNNVLGKLLEEIQDPKMQVVEIQNSLTRDQSRLTSVDNMIEVIELLVLNLKSSNDNTNNENSFVQQIDKVILRDVFIESNKIDGKIGKLKIELQMKQVSKFDNNTTTKEGLNNAINHHGREKIEIIMKAFDDKRDKDQQHQDELIDVSLKRIKSMLPFQRESYHENYLISPEKPQANVTGVVQLENVLLDIVTSAIDLCDTAASDDVIFVSDSKPLESSTVEEKDSSAPMKMVDQIIDGILDAREHYAMINVHENDKNEMSQLGRFQSTTPSPNNKTIGVSEAFSFDDQQSPPQHSTTSTRDHLNSYLKSLIDMKHFKNNDSNDVDKNILKTSNKEKDINDDKSLEKSTSVHNNNSVESRHEGSGGVKQLEKVAKLQRAVDNFLKIANEIYKEEEMKEIGGESSTNFIHIDDQRTPVVTGDDLVLIPFPPKNEGQSRNDVETTEKTKVQEAQGVTPVDAVRNDFKTSVTAKSSTQDEPLSFDDVLSTEKVSTTTSVNSTSSYLGKMGTYVVGMLATAATGILTLAYPFVSTSKTDNRASHPLKSKTEKVDKELNPLYLKADLKNSRPRFLKPPAGENYRDRRLRKPSQANMIKEIYDVREHFMKEAQNDLVRKLNENNLNLMKKLIKQQRDTLVSIPPNLDNYMKYDSNNFQKNSQTVVVTSKPMVSTSHYTAMDTKTSQKPTTSSIEMVEVHEQEPILLEPSVFNLANKVENYDERRPKSATTRPRPVYISSSAKQFPVTDQTENTDVILEPITTNVRSQSQLHSNLPEMLGSQDYENLSIPPVVESISDPKVEGSENEVNIEGRNLNLPTHSMLHEDDDTVLDDMMKTASKISIILLHPNSQSMTVANKQSESLSDNISEVIENHMVEMPVFEQPPSSDRKDVNFVEAPEVHSTESSLTNVLKNLKDRGPTEINVSSAVDDEIVTGQEVEIVLHGLEDEEKKDNQSSGSRRNKFFKATVIEDTEYSHNMKNTLNVKNEGKVGGNSRTPRDDDDRKLMESENIEVLSNRVMMSDSNHLLHRLGGLGAILVITIVFLITIFTAAIVLFLALTKMKSKHVAPAHQNTPPPGRGRHNKFYSPVNPGSHNRSITSTCPTLSPTSFGGNSQHQWSSQYSVSNGSTPTPPINCFNRNVMIDRHNMLSQSGRKRQDRYDVHPKNSSCASNLRSQQHRSSPQLISSSSIGSFANRRIIANRSPSITSTTFTSSSIYPTSPMLSSSSTPNPDCRRQVVASGRLGRLRWQRHHPAPERTAVDTPSPRISEFHAYEFRIPGRVEQERRGGGIGIASVSVTDLKLSRQYNNKDGMDNRKRNEHVSFS